MPFAGTATDPESGLLPAGSLVWTSSKDGQIGTGSSFTKSNLSLGSHIITLTATDPQGVIGTAAVAITIAPAPNQPPTAVITSPAAISAIQGTAISFAGTGTDPETGALTGTSLVWTSSRDGQIGTGVSFAKSNLTVGAHTITLTATDAQGATGTATTNITIVAPNQPPTASISAPVANSTVTQGAPVAFVGSGNDPETGALAGASLAWVSSRDGQIGAGTSFTTSTLSVGTHTITLTATDNQGATGTATTTITILAPVNQPPVAAITSPAPNATVVSGTSVSFSGTGTDPESGALSGTALVWRSNLDGQIGTGTAFFKSNLTVGTHSLSLVTTDPQGLADTASTILTVAASGSTTVTATILAPLANANFAAGATVTFNGSGTDGQVAIVGKGLTWNSSRDGDFGSGVTLTRSNLSVGQHVITLTARSATLVTGRTSIVITIGAGANQPPTAVITSPTTNSTVAQGTTVVFSGSGNDPETGVLSGASLVWTSSRDGQIGTGTSFSRSTLSIGTHAITLTAIDAQGAIGTASTTVTVVAPNQPPTASITSPAANSSTVQGTAITFAGSGNDPETGALSGGSLVWTSSRDGQIGTGASFSRSTLTVGTHVITLTVTDPQGASNVTTITITVVPPPNQPPTASITSPSNNSSVLQGTTVVFSGSGNDPETGALSGAALVWVSSRDGQIGTGTSFSKANLSVGAHTITLTATDNLGATAIATTTITILQPNQPPVAAISSPAASQSFVQGAAVSFAGTGTDPESGALSGASLVWTSSRDGQIGTGASFSRSNLTLGAHTITLTATDPQGATGTATISITIVTPPNQPPTAAISQPADNSTIVQGSSVSFAGSGTDPETGALSGASLVWTSSRDGQIGVGASFSTTTLSLGTHTITLKATDAQGAFGSAAITIAVVPPPNQAPIATITAPGTNTTVVQRTTVAFAGNANDPESGALTGAALVWTSSLDGQIGTGTSFSTSSLSLGTHTITLTAMDPQGATGTATMVITITVPPNQPPTVSITSPAAGSSFVQGTSISFAGNASDPESGALTGAALVWTSSRDGQIGTGTSFSTSALSLGTHTITLTGRDPQGASATTSQTIYVTAPPSTALNASFTFACGPSVSATPHTCTLDGSASTGGVKLWVWNLGNGMTPSKKTPIATYTWASAGTYWVTLTVIDAIGATNAVSMSVQVP